MSESQSPIKDFAPIAAPFVALIADIYIKPELQRMAKALKGRTVRDLSKTFEAYLSRSYEYYSYIPILVFQNQNRLLRDVYVPLTLRRSHAQGPPSVTIDSYPEGLMNDYGRILIRDSAGMGKSTLMKKLFLSCVEGNFGIPVFVELRKLTGEVTIVDFLLNELNELNREFDKDLIRNLIKAGGFVFFLDGFDEIPERSRSAVTAELRSFISKSGENKFFLTSRPDTSLAAFPNFIEFDIRPLRPDEAYTLIRKYDHGGTLAERIIDTLKGPEGNNLGEFLSNPLMVSLLFKAYEYKNAIPIRKSNFYRQVFDALFESHDLTKEGWNRREKRSNLDIDSFHAVLRVLGFITFRFGVEFEKDELLAHLRNAKLVCGHLQFKESDFLADLLSAVPLFIAEGSKIRWSHKSIQEYFTAQYIWLDGSDRKVQILDGILDNYAGRHYANVLELFADVDPKTFRQHLLLRCTKEIIQHFQLSIDYQLSSQPSDDEKRWVKWHTIGRSFAYFSRELEVQIVGHGIDVRADSPAGFEDLLAYAESRGCRLSRLDGQQFYEPVVGGGWIIEDWNKKALMADILLQAGFGVQYWDRTVDLRSPNSANWKAIKFIAFTPTQVVGSGSEVSIENFAEIDRAPQFTLQDLRRLERELEAEVEAEKRLSKILSL